MTTPEKTIEAFVRDIHDTHGAANAAAAMVATNAGLEPGNEAHISQQVGILMLHLCDLTRAIVLESHTGMSSTAMQELTLHFEACGRALHQGIVKASLFDREEILGSICNIELASNALAHLANFQKTKADEHVIECAMRGTEPDLKPYV